jgi:hypothetical protein
MCIELVPERWILRYGWYFEVDHWIRYKD